MNDQNDQVTQPTDEPIVTETTTETTTEEGVDRREMLSAAVRFSSVLGLFGLSVDALFADEADAKRAAPGVNGGALKRLLAEALERGDMEAAIKKFGAQTKLSPAQLNQLRQISSNDLRMLKSIRQRFNKALKGIADVAPWQVHEHNAYRNRK